MTYFYKTKHLFNLLMAPTIHPGPDAFYQATYKCIGKCTYSHGLRQISALQNWIKQKKKTKQGDLPIVL